MRRAVIWVALLGLAGCVTGGSKAGGGGETSAKTTLQTAGVLARRACARLKATPFPVTPRTRVEARLTPIDIAERQGKKAEAERLADALMRDCLAEVRLRAEAARVLALVNDSASMLDLNGRQLLQKMAAARDYDGVIVCGQGLLQHRPAACQRQVVARRRSVRIGGPSALRPRRPTPTPGTASKQATPTPPARSSSGGKPADPTPTAARPEASGDGGDDDDGSDSTPDRGLRFRWGIAATGGGTFVAGYELFMGGIDARLGVQINDLLGVYLQPHFSIGGGDIGGLTGLTGFVGSSALVDVTLFDRLFASAGAGFMVLNNPVAAQLHFRLGGYPLASKGDAGGFMLGVDLRLYFVEGVTVMSLFGSIGYEAF